MPSALFSRSCCWPAVMAAAAQAHFLREKTVAVPLTTIKTTTTTTCPIQCFHYLKVRSNYESHSAHSYLLYWRWYGAATWQMIVMVTYYYIELFAENTTLRIGPSLVMLAFRGSTHTASLILFFYQQMTKFVSTTILVSVVSLLLTTTTTTTLAFAPSPQNPPSSTSSTTSSTTTNLDAVTVRGAPPTTTAGRTPNKKHKSAATTTTKSKAIVVDSTKLRRSKWGVDNENEDEYWFNDQVSRAIHVMSCLQLYCSRLYSAPRIGTHRVILPSTCHILSVTINLKNHVLTPYIQYTQLRSTSLVTRAFSVPFTPP